MNADILSHSVQYVKGFLSSLSRIPCLPLTEAQKGAKIGVMEIGDSLTKREEELSEGDQEIILEALELHYAKNLPLETCFDRTPGMAVATYYRRKNAFPRDIDRLDRQARENTLVQRDGIRIAFESETLERSITLQQRSMAALEEAIGRLSEIVHLQGWEVPGDDGANRQVRIYPRDVLSATRMLHEIARDGLIPQAQQYVRAMRETQDKEDTPEPGFSPPPFFNTEFSLVEGTKPDGTRFKFELTPGNVIESEES